MFPLRFHVEQNRNYANNLIVMECWRSHHGNVLNHAPATMCSDLDSAANSATPDLTIPVDAPFIEEVVAAIRKLKNARAPAGPDGIQPELLKYAETPVSSALHALFI